jgi:hypothetical protein
VIKRVASFAQIDGKLSDGHVRRAIGAERIRTTSGCPYFPCAVFVPAAVEL